MFFFFFLKVKPSFQIGEVWKKSGTVHKLVRMPTIQTVCMIGMCPLKFIS